MGKELKPRFLINKGTQVYWDRLKNIEEKKPKVDALGGADMGPIYYKVCAVIFAIGVGFLVPVIFGYTKMSWLWWAAGIRRSPMLCFWLPPATV